MRSVRAAGVLVFVLAAGVHGNAVLSGFAFDDCFYVTLNGSVKAFDAGRLVSERYWEGAGQPAPYWRPAAMLTLGAQYALAGERPWSFHLVNVLLHAGASVLVFLLAVRLTGAVTAALVGAAVFAVHPVGVEAVSSIGHRPDLLACFFAVAAVHLHSGEPAKARTAGAIAAFALACASKEIGLTVLAPILTLDLAVRCRGRVSEFLRVLRGPVGVAWAGYAAVAAAYLLVRHSVIGGFAPPTIGFAENPLAIEPLWIQKLLALSVLGRCVALLLWPARLSVDYGFHVLELQLRHAWPSALLGVIALAALAYVALRSARRRPSIAVGLVLAGAAWLPTSNLVFPIEVMMAERFLYVPLAGVGLALAGALTDVSLPRRVLAPVVGLVLVALGTRTVARTFDWRDDATLLRATVTAYPQSVKAQVVMGHSHRVAREYPAALAAYARAVAIYPEHAVARTSYARTEVLLAESLQRSGDRAGALAAYARALEVRPEYAPALSDRAALLRELGRPLDAIASARRAVEVDPADSIVWFNYAVELEHAGRTEQLVAVLRDATARFPADAALRDFRLAAERRVAAR